MEVSSKAVLHVHVLLVSPLYTSRMTQPSIDQHKSGIAVRETAYHTDATADLPVQPSNDVVGADTSPVFAGKIAVGQCLRLSQTLCKSLAWCSADSSVAGGLVFAYI